LNQHTVNEKIVTIGFNVDLFHWLYFDSMLTIVSLTAFWFNVDYCFTDCILVRCWLLLQSVKQVNIEAKYSQWNNSQHRTKIQSVKQVNIEAKYSQWSNSQHRTKMTVFWFNVDYYFIDCILVQCWLLFHWLYFGSMLTIVSLTVFWLNVDYCFIDCVLVQFSVVNIEPTYSQWNNSHHWAKIQSMKQ
jgi:hypothetical protein